MRTRLDKGDALNSRAEKRTARSRHSARVYVARARSTWPCEQAHIGTCRVTAAGHALYAINEMKSGISRLY